jgi:hypothetical protein
MRQVSEVLRLRTAGRGQRDCPRSRCCAVHCSANLEATGECRVHPAIAGRDDRHRAGGGTLCCGRHQASCSGCAIKNSTGRPHPRRTPSGSSGSQRPQNARKQRWGIPKRGSGAPSSLVQRLPDSVTPKIGAHGGQGELRPCESCGRRVPSMAAASGALFGSMPAKGLPRAIEEAEKRAPGHVPSSRRKRSLQAASSVM